ncbi:hypothetical protein FGU65_06785 [Methanoculleus sp. FWC-SCC1]|uniref:Uncharacterized protein n=1 Tax=Methanoculleus frigidifontis TaxID=2584085 RepID=A0ABT8M9H3_9EURY|nr:hypothetical protein [Methanoculleus sp. FWC-SCC1]MDN7024594.1 hypothetical protein [Methanoculleus sp. FWC-SCC1]
MAPAETAYLDLEFGYVYGTARAVIMPIEIGVVVHRQEDDTVRYRGEVFRYDIDVEIWKKVADDCGRTVGVSTSVANTGAGDYGRPYDHFYRVSEEAVEGARTTARAAFRDLGTFMETLLSGGDVPALVVFAADMEKMAFRQADVPLDGCSIVDLQKEIRRRMHLQHVLSLDRAARLVDFRADGGAIASTHFHYPVPAPYRDCLQPHRGMGDAARIFLLSREFSERREAFSERVRHLVAACETLRDPEPGE